MEGRDCSSEGSQEVGKMDYEEELGIVTFFVV